MRRRQSCALLVAEDQAIAVPAERHTRALFDTVWVSGHARGDGAVPPGLSPLMQFRQPDYLFSLLSPVILPQAVLESARVGCINFHPAPPEYPGVGACSYALYDRCHSFGATAHMMAARVDSGTILAVKRFPIRDDDECDTLSRRARAASLELFKDLLEGIAAEGLPTPSGDQWARRASSSQDFMEWMTLDPDCETREMERIIRAVRHPCLPGPFVSVHGHRFAYFGPCMPQPPVNRGES